MGKLSVYLTEPAEHDLGSIYGYLELEAGIAVADRILTEIEQAFDRVAEFPEAGPSREEIMSGYRVVFAAQYGIYYRFDAEILFVMRVLHMSMDAARAKWP